MAFKKFRAATPGSCNATELRAAPISLSSPRPRSGNAALDHLTASWWETVVGNLWTIFCLPGGLERPSLSNGCIRRQKAEQRRLTPVPDINISQAPVPESLQKPVPVSKPAASSEESHDWSLDQDQDADHVRNETQYSAADGPTTLDIVTYSLRITFEGQEVSSKHKNVPIHLSNVSNYEGLASKAEECFKEQFHLTNLAGRSLNFRHGECAITCKKNDKSFGNKHTHGLSNDADWQHLCTVLQDLYVSSGGPDIHLDIHREYFGLLIRRVSEEAFAKAKRLEIYNLMKTAFDGSKYLPQSDLEKVMSKDMVRGVITDDSTVQLVEKETFIEEVSKRAPKLLTMCVLAGMQMSCLKLLLEKGLNDNTKSMKEEHCCHKKCAQDFATLLQWYRGLNAATFLQPGQHQRLAKGTVVPVHYHPKHEDQMTSRTESSGDASEKEIESDEETEYSDKRKALCGSGAYSKDTHAVFALKEFRDRPHRKGADFNKELKFLTELYRCPDKNIVLHLATWTQDGRYYMLFPYAECNLRQYMERHTLSPLTKRNVLWLLAQFQGLSRAIRGIHNLNPETGTNLLAPQQGPRQSGWHHDLKPENILYFEEIAPKAGSFKIADFGSGKVHTYRSGTGSHNTRSPNGTPTYEPPEVVKNGETSRRYDMWSMGCVFIEMLIWAVYDYDSVKSFGDSRVGRRSPDNAFFDDAFWQIDDDRNFIRRPSVDEWLEKLGGKLQHENLQALLEVLGLVNRMLDTSIITRITAPDLWKALNDINSQTEIDPEAHEDDPLSDQSTPQNSRGQKLSLSTKEPDRDVSHLASPIVVSKPESQSPQTSMKYILGDHLTASPQNTSSNLRSRNSSLSDNTAHSGTSMRDRASSDLFTTGTQPSNSLHSSAGRTPDVSNTKHNRGSLGSR
ncbi:MAG: hypothetical protein Q9195_005331 [Heterodermia aff. obscurata]